MSEIRADIRQITDRVGRIEERLGRMEVGIAKIQARVEHLPTVWTLVATMIGAVVGSVGTVLTVVAIFAP